MRRQAVLTLISLGCCLGFGIGCGSKDDPDSEERVRRAGPFSPGAATGKPYCADVRVTNPDAVEGVDCVDPVHLIDKIGPWYSKFEIVAEVDLRSTPATASEFERVGWQGDDRFVTVLGDLRVTNCLLGDCTRLKALLSSGCLVEPGPESEPGNCCYMWGHGCPVITGGANLVVASFDCAWDYYYPGLMGIGAIYPIIDGMVWDVDGTGMAIEEIRSAVVGISQPPQEQRNGVYGCDYGRYPFVPNADLDVTTPDDTPLSTEVVGE